MQKGHVLLFSFETRLLALSFCKCGEILIDNVRLVRGGSPSWRLALDAKADLADRSINRAYLLHACLQDRMFAEFLTDVLAVID